MRNILCSLAILSLVVCGCSSSTPSSSTGSSKPKESEKESTKSTSKGKSKVVKFPDKDAKIEVDKVSVVMVSKGKKGTGRFTVKRTKYDGEIQCKFTAPEGSGLTFSETVIPAGQNEAKFTITAAEDATGGMVQVDLIGEGLEEQLPFFIRILPN